MLSTRTIPAFIVSAALGVAPAVAMAGLAHPASWKQVSEDDQYVLVMVSPLPLDEDAGHEAFDAREIRNIRETYSQSGLFPNDGTTTPLWTLPYHNWTHEVFIGPDGQHLIIADDDWFQSHGHVVTFYSNGNELASYSITDLLSSTYLRMPILRRIDGGAMTFDTDALTFTSRTNQGGAFVFDVTSGKIVRRSSPIPKFIGIAIAGIAMAVVFLLLLMRRERYAAPSMQSPKTESSGT